MDKNSKKRRVIFGSILTGLLLVGIAIFLIVVVYSTPKKDTSRASNHHKTSESSMMKMSSTQGSKSDPIQTALTEWKGLALNQQIALLAQSYAKLNPQSTILSSDHMAMTGDIDDGTIEWYDSNKIIHKVNVKINQTMIKYNYINAETWETEEQVTKIDTVLADYFETPTAKQVTEEIASRLIDSARLTSLNAEMNLEQIAQGDYSSVQGTWKNLAGSTLTFETNQCYIVEGEQKTRLILTTLSADNPQNQRFLMVNSNPEGSPAGAGLSFIPTGYDWADTDKAKPRIWLSNTFGPSVQNLPERQKLGIQEAIYYKVD